VADVAEVAIKGNVPFTVQVVRVVVPPDESVSRLKTTTLHFISILLQ
jgi:hypothetical protein